MAVAIDVVSFVYGGVDSMPNNNPQQTTQQQIARAAEGASKVAERLESSAENAASVAIEKVRQVRDEAQSGIEHQRDQIADRIRRIGGVLRSGSQTLSTDDPLSQQLFETAGDRIDRLANYVGNITPAELANDVQSLARRSPGLFFGGSFILGLALGRFAKSTASALSAAASEDDAQYEQTAPARAAAPRKRQGQGQGGSQRKASARTTQGSAGQSSQVSAGQSSQCRAGQSTQGSAGQSS
ncbi:MAG: hypothetical protein JWN04_1169, partial [Myxococcaceae bacterium]|nr:hypothetical protein [Myxococcaceae bacterium]